MHPSLLPALTDSVAVSAAGNTATVAYMQISASWLPGFGEIPSVPYAFLHAQGLAQGWEHGGSREILDEEPSEVKPCPKPNSSAQNSKFMGQGCPAHSTSLPNENLLHE